MTKVLIVEDNVLLRTAYISLLTREGYQVDFACDGNEALQKDVTKHSVSPKAIVALIKESLAQKGH